jgi:hypothetical protein
MPAQTDSGLQIFLRVALVIWGLVLLVLTFGFMMQFSWALLLWPWPDSHLTYIFLGAVVSAIALPCIWIGLSGEFAALRAATLSMALMQAGSAVSLLWLLQATGNLQLISAIGVAAVSALLSLLIFFLCRGVTLRDQQPVPVFIQIFLFLFALLLIVIGSALVVQIRNIFPWSLKVETSILLGWIFYATASYFIYALLFPQWGYVSGPLLGLLTHDLIMIGPLVMQFARGETENLPILIAYLAVVIVSLFIAVYFLFIHRSTRFWNRRISRPISG